MYVAIAGAAWFAQQQGWLNNDKGGEQQASAQTRQDSSSNNSREEIDLSQNTQSQSNRESAVNTKNSRVENDHALIAKLYQQKRSDEIVTAVGRVARVLPDDNKGSRHQKFLLDIGQPKWLLVAHNIDLAPYVPLKQGDQVIVHGEYEWTEKGGVLHWTHHDPRGYHEEGYIEHNGKKYK
ncbi:MAG: DUF3465 domain-containing protein [Gammaproteobacteria bacterium]|nr:DUF3465 domain-containing protein [Gammaproteobacteria bacterium]NNC98440.1 DUF3465 domain-containing protein [Gammaproteobacteria bacterium]NNM14747.1 DUF3465 domain-containing protein [Gammaproteobacteria bacterium]